MKLNKKCSKCKQIKSLREFYKNRVRPDGHQSYCKLCHVISKNPESSRRYNRKWVQKNHEKIQVWRDNNPEKVRGAYQKWNLMNPEKRRAHNAINIAVTSGKIRRPKICSDCGSKGIIQGHHEDYEKLLDVIWLCKLCHMSLHRKLEEQS